MVSADPAVRPAPPGPSALRTPRLLLRPYTPEVARAIVAADPRGRRWAAGFPRDDDQDVADHYLRQPADAAAPWRLPYELVLLETGETIGGIGLFEVAEEDAVEVGYGLVPGAEGRGLATEALVALLTAVLALPAVRRVVAITEHANAASQRVLEKAGMVRIGADAEMYHYTTPGPGVRRYRADRENR
ncbi:GNAT family N-acetyltransferase [Allostreptomyces psammosilenae]|uniref:RimJ/RimL family protein N-acetyltransferase n=1 Tax=Allostreptomyces psammosilenae TaxID=1892865 RepID=A0A853A1Q2_9ACTN|nr:GNAT family N-acetyltransferase [Allostreptomyces psammosilenae]NYI04442.1 RimJ/RimL family protein N-acetyltransferase [Allostreptomyces psammosilenae]